jgi:hypothetical protein
MFSPIPHSWLNTNGGDEPLSFLEAQIASRFEAIALLAIFFASTPHSAITTYAVKGSPSP